MHIHLKRYAQSEMEHGIVMVAIEISICVTYLGAVRQERLFSFIAIPMFLIYNIDICAVLEV